MPNFHDEQSYLLNQLKNADLLYPNSHITTEEILNKLLTIEQNERLDHKTRRKSSLNSDGSRRLSARSGRSSYNSHHDDDLHDTNLSLAHHQAVLHERDTTEHTQMVNGHPVHRHAAPAAATRHDPQVGVALDPGLEEEELAAHKQQEFVERNKSIFSRTPLFYFGGYNGLSLVENYLTSLGWERTLDKTREDYKLKWCDVKQMNNYLTHREGEQLLYQIPKSKLLTTKIGLLKCLQEYDRVMQKVQNGPSRQKIMSYQDFFPESYRLDVKDDREAFFNRYKDDEMWISKPTGANQGRGIYIIRDRAEVDRIRAKAQEVQESLSSTKRGATSTTTRQPFLQRLVQKYVTNPLLLEGRKFDVRNYMMIVNSNPFVVFYRDGYCRLTCTEYDNSSLDLTSHLTNQFVQKQSSMYDEVKEETVWSMDRFNDYINDNFADNPDSPVEIPRDWVHTVLKRRCQQVMRHCFNSARHRLDARTGYIDLIGCDFLVHDDFSISILEMNSNPALSTNCEALKECMPKVVEQFLGLSLECFDKAVRNERILPIQLKHDCVLLYNDDYHEKAERRERARVIAERNSKMRQEQRRKQFKQQQYQQQASYRKAESLKAEQKEGFQVAYPKYVPPKAVASQDRLYQNKPRWGEAAANSTNFMSEKEKLKPFKAGVVSNQQSRVHDSTALPPARFNTATNSRYAYVSSRINTGAATSTTPTTQNQLPSSLSDKSPLYLKQTAEQNRSYEDSIDSIDEGATKRSVPIITSTFDVQTANTDSMAVTKDASSTNAIGGRTSIDAGNSARTSTGATGATIVSSYNPIDLDQEQRDGLDYLQRLVSSDQNQKSSDNSNQTKMRKQSNSYSGAGASERQNQPPTVANYEKYMKEKLKQRHVASLSVKSFVSGGSGANPDNSNARNYEKRRSQPLSPTRYSLQMPLNARKAPTTTSPPTQTGKTGAALTKQNSNSTLLPSTGCNLNHHHQRFSVEGTVMGRHSSPLVVATHLTTPPSAGRQRTASRGDKRRPYRASSLGNRNNNNSSSVVVNSAREQIWHLASRSTTMIKRQKSQPHGGAFFHHHHHHNISNAPA